MYFKENQLYDLKSFFLCFHYLCIVAKLDRIGQGIQKWDYAHWKVNYTSKVILTKHLQNIQTFWILMTL